MAQAGGLPGVRGTLPSPAVIGEWGNLPGVRGTFPALAVTGEGDMLLAGRAAPDQPLRLWGYALQRCYRPLPLVLLAVNYMRFLVLCMAP